MDSDSTLDARDEHVLYAHSPSRAGHGEWHDLVEHLSAVADLAAAFAEPMGAADAALMLGWWHDAGKSHPQWQRYLRDAVRHPERATRGPDHSSVGMLALRSAPRCDLLAFLVANHHGGLCNLHALKDRVHEKERDAYMQEALEAAHALIDEHCPLRPVALPEVLAKPRTAGLALRMLHSCLVDADCLDTERHFTPAVHRSRVSDVPIETLAEQLISAQEELMQGAVGDLNARRRSMYEDAREHAQAPRGFFSLTMPTGAGKTRTGMAFALEHCRRHGMRRVIVAIPFTSIIEQNADVYREIFGEHAVLEHHSSRTRPDSRRDELDAERWQRLAAQNWDAPIIVTTNVQLFESLFGARNHKVRKLHNIMGSTIILDEVQTLPPKLVPATLHALNLLVEEFGCSIVFSTATQPAFRRDVLGEIGVEGLAELTEIIQEPEEHFTALSRVRYEILDEVLTFETLAERLEGRRRVLIILNTVADTLKLLDALQGRFLDDRLLYLSTRLCGAHRREVLAEVRGRLERGEPCVLVSTQVVEAGVDLDFPSVFRVMGPLEAIVQAAGRCNREGRLEEKGEVVVFELEDSKTPPGAYRTATDLARQTLQRGADLHRPDVFLRYFRTLYASTEHTPVLEAEGKCRFEDVDDPYRLIDDESVSVLVQRAGASEDEARQIRAMLRDVAARGAQHGDLRRLQPWLVNLRQRDFERACSEGLAVPVDANDVLYEWRGGYDPLRGLTETLDVHQLIF